MRKSVIFDSFVFLFENLRFSRRETKSREENVPFSLNTREIGSLGSMGAVRAHKLGSLGSMGAVRALEIAHFWAYFSLISVKFSEFHVKIGHFREKLLIFPKNSEKFVKIC